MASIVPAKLLLQLQSVLTGLLVHLLHLQRSQPCLGAAVTAPVNARRSLLPCLQAAAVEATATEDTKKAAFYKVSVIKLYIC